MDLTVLNKEQKEAVLYNDGPLLIIAGAGSGKTRVLTYKVAYLIENGVDPSSILAITFTNKAADEMKERIYGLLEGKALSGRPFVSTFHKFCGNILTKYIDTIGYDKGYVIYDTDDQKKLMKQIISNLYGDESKLKEKMVLSVIRKCKNHNISKEEYNKDAYSDIEKMISKCFYEYEDRLYKANAIDFDDMLLLAVRVLKENNKALSELNDKYKYILIDEYQDTNLVQFDLVKYLTLKHKYVTVVGDDDQSIYKFRGADINNILSFEASYKNAKVIKLTHNYRSTQQILDVANDVIKNNNMRKEKELWCDVTNGDKVVYSDYPSDDDEAYSVIKDIAKNKDYKNTCILYRTNAMSRKLEKMCKDQNVPYKLIGGVSFYQRKEVKDVLAYLRVIVNDKDDVSLLRIINVPKRGIGETSLKKIAEYAKNNNISIYEALEKAADIGVTKKAVEASKSFIEFIEKLSKKDNVVDIIQDILDSGYEEEIRENDDKDTANERIQNIQELKNDFMSYKERLLSDDTYDENEKAIIDNNIQTILQNYLYNTALYEVTDEMEDEKDKLTLMTLHASKGLEYENVYIVGLNEYIFPSTQSIMADDSSDIEEERRLMYVGVTRAKRKLYLTSSRFRFYNGM
ncbi:MAG: UvrD-helicase domain-containing protein, partial [Lachnospiraceae bacterium]|nr:UvrD-helicase domain-containing protein [Lachnospiraceae bacterium]